MKSNDLRTHQLLDLISSYQTGSTEFSSLCFKSELMLEDMRLNMSGNEYARAINCVYVLEEINALILDETRPASQAERAEIENQLVLLEKIVTQKNESN